MPQTIHFPPVSTTRSITLTIRCSFYRDANDGRVQGQRIRIEASDAVDMTDKIFMYQQLSKNATTGALVDTFDHVASPPDIAETPEDAPDAGDPRPAWFRKDYIDLLLRSKTETDDLIEAVCEEVEQLKATYDIMDTIDGVTTKIIGAQPAPSSSSSSSSSV